MTVSNDNFVVLNNTSQEKNNTLKELSQKLFHDNANIAYKKFIQREKEFSTGLVDGFAIPHAKLDFIDEISYYFVKLDKQVNWNTLDNKPVDVLVVLIIPDKKSNHLKILSTISKLMMKEQFKKAIKDEDIKKINEMLKEAT